MNQLIDEMEKIGILKCERLETYFSRVRDREDVAVLRDPLTEVIVLSRCDHVSETYYKERQEKSSYSVHGQELNPPRLEDNIRRATDFGGYIRNKRWLDFGCGLGGMLDELAADASWAAGLEPNKDRAAIISAKGHNVIEKLVDIDENSLDIVTMFHVMEHLTNPLEILKSIRRVLRPEGKLLVEVPHARDVLFTLYDCEEFKRFTFWSEHLILHTRQSLTQILHAAGFKQPQVMGHQRYPLSNHLYWLSKNEPGGHVFWSVLNSPSLKREYESVLGKIDRNDTLIALAIS